MIDPGDCGALRFEAIAHPSRQVRIGAFVEIAAADAGLSRHDNDRPPQLVGPETSQIENSGNELELLRPMNVATVHIDDAITVQKKRAVGHINFRVQLSATSSRNPTSSARGSKHPLKSLLTPYRRGDVDPAAGRMCASRRSGIARDIPRPRPA